MAAADHRWMPTRNGPIQEAIRKTLQLHLSVANELRDARIASGVSQAAVDAAVGVSRNFVSRVELAKVPRLSVAHVTRHAAVLGLRPSVKLYPIGAGLRDAAQVRYIAKFVERTGHAWRVSLDVPMPLPGDLRAVDVVLEGACTIAVEIVTRLSDLQATLRAAQLKQRDLGATRLVVVVSGTHANRRALAEARPSLLATFDLDTQRVFAELAAGHDPGRDSIIVLTDRCGFAVQSNEGVVTTGWLNSSCPVQPGHINNLMRG